MYDTKVHLGLPTKHFNKNKTDNNHLKFYGENNSVTLYIRVINQIQRLAFFVALYNIFSIRYKYLYRYYYFFKYKSKSHAGIVYLLETTCGFLAQFFFLLLDYIPQCNPEKVI